MARKRIGIEALFNTSVPDAVPAQADEPREFVDVDVEALVPGAHQPRRSFDPTALEQLAESVKQHGILQPLLVRPTAAPGQFEIVAGERRWRAARSAGLARVPVRVVELDNTAALAVAVVENLQREDLNPLEEAEGYIELLRARLDSEPAYQPFRDTQDSTAGVLRILRMLNNRAAGNIKDSVVLASLEPVVSEVFARVGKLTWPTFVAHRLPLLGLPGELKAPLRDGMIPYTKARLIARLTPERLGTDDARARRIRRDLIEQIVTEGLSLRGLKVEIDRITSAQKDAIVESPDTPPQPEPTVGTLATRIEALRSRLDSTTFEALSADRQDEIAKAVDALLKVI